MNKIIKMLLTIIEKLCNMTQSREIEWIKFNEYILSHHINQGLRRYSIKIPELQSLGSYVLEINGGVITLGEYLNSENKPYYILLAQRTPNSRTVELNVKQEFQEQLRLLHNLIAHYRTQDDEDITDFLQNLINMEV